MITKHALVRVFEDDDLIAVNSNIREQDRVEIEASSGLFYEKCLERAIKYSDKTWTGLVDGQVVAIFGINCYSALTKSGIPWLISTKEIEKHSILFLRHCKTVFEMLAEPFNYLENYVHEDNSVAILWLKWLGFEFEEAKPFGFQGEMFHKFSMRKNYV